jgi:carboxylesterase type B
MCVILFSCVVPDSPQLGGVEAFLGVPYAGAPVGRLRFMPPSAPQSWPPATVRKAAEFGPVCPQIVPDLSREKEALREKMAIVFSHFCDENP